MEVPIADGDGGYGECAPDLVCPRIGPVQFKAHIAGAVIWSAGVLQTTLVGEAVDNGIDR